MKHDHVACRMIVSFGVVYMKMTLGEMSLNIIFDVLILYIYYVL